MMCYPWDEHYDEACWALEYAMHYRIGNWRYLD